MRVLVCGGAGFIGSHIVDGLLRNGHQPYVIDDLSTGSLRNLPSQVKLFEFDVCDRTRVREVFEEVRPDWVCHQAAQMSVSRSMREPAFDAQVNIIGLINVLEQSVRYEVRRFVFASSGGVLYGDVSEPAVETTSANPISPYGIAKWAGEQYLQFFAREHGIKAVALRYANVFGPRQNPHGEAGVVAIFCKRLLAGESITINGDGRYTRDYVFVKDVAEANLLALETELPEPFLPLNIGTGVGTDVNELAAAIRHEIQEIWKASGKAATVPESQYGPARSGDLRSNLVCAARIKQRLGWAPKVRINEGLRETVAWFAGQTPNAL